MGSREDYKQEKSIRKGQVLGTMEGMYGQGRYLGEQREFEEYNGTSQRI